MRYRMWRHRDRGDVRSRDSVRRGHAIDDCARIIHAALDSGINFIDAADSSSRPRKCEAIIGKAFVVAATMSYSRQVPLRMGKGRNRSGNSRRWIVRALDESLAATNRLDRLPSSPA